ncbi:hypothetical protein AAHZ94_09385 [Streptomyces sp. HSW2009]|uniref:hypothetical protein n=1 Tax=Streptomyces sp. HSW2009 TaxID=3142890 RepID=UPI0032EBD0DB
MSDDVRNVLLGLVASGISAALGWFVRTYTLNRAFRSKLRFFGLRPGEESLLVVNGKAGQSSWTVARQDVFALLELSMLIKACKSEAKIVPHDAPGTGLGQITEFCIGGPISNDRMAAHLRNLLPGFTMDVETESGPQCGAFTVGGEVYRMEPGHVEYVLLARLRAHEGARPIFLICGQRALTNFAAARYVNRHHAALAQTHGEQPFCLLLKVVDSEAYGAEVIQLVTDITQTALSPRPPQPALQE